MTPRLPRLACLALIAALLGGCKMELYGNLPEAEANRMLALLMLRRIDAEKETTKGDTATILVDRSQFVDAVELLRQNGLPSRHLATIEDLFPPGQLVTSPAQEQAKITFLKEQQLQRMLLSMDGVIEAQVAIAETPATGRYDPPIPSASVFIKYSPDRNLEARLAQIRELVVKGVPGLQPENVTVVMQRTDYEYLSAPQAASSAAVPATAHRPAAAPARAHLGLWLAAPLLALGALLAGAVLFLQARSRKTK